MKIQVVEVSVPTAVMEKLDAALDEGGWHKAVAMIAQGLLEERPEHTEGENCVACLAEYTAALLAYILDKHKWN